MMKSLIRWTLLLAVILGGLYWWFAYDGAMPPTAKYTLDMAEVRQAADAMPGDKPSGIRYEHILSYRFPGAMVVSGDGWGWTEMPVYAYQLLYADRTVIIDTGQDRQTAQPKFVVPFYDDEAWLRLQAALDKTSLVVITHEHMDHIGGLAAHADTRKLMTKVQLNDMQVAHPERMKPVVWPAGALDGYQPLKYDRVHAVAPGVVLIKAAGHTPGSQMVYVKMADGKELLFLGDVAWHARNVETQKERPRFTTDWIIKEDRLAVFGQLRALHTLAESDPAVLQVPGHDAGVIDTLMRKGVLQPRFVN
ncbi:MAG TPA: MBL fold metallo-hydrolase [Nevskiaceae bacterium]|nr:MBL fold metallo-hydrolase [Nevskiaceae bacterium]